MQEIKVGRPRQCLRFGDAGGEGVPGHNGLDGGERIAAALLGLNQRLTDAPIHPHLVVDRLAGSLELLLMLVLGRVEQLADDAIVKVDDFIGDGGHAFDGQRYQRGIASLHLELCQISRRHLATFTSDFEQAVLVNLPLDACGQIKCLPGFQALNMFEHVARVRFGRRLAQPCQPRHFTAVLALEKFVQALTVG